LAGRVDEALLNKISWTPIAADDRLNYPATNEAVSAPGLALILEEALRRLIVVSETQYDPQVVQCFIRIAQSEMPAVFAATGTSTTVAL
jgi:hypothetical protein